MAEKKTTPILLMTASLIKMISSLDDAQNRINVSTFIASKILGFAIATNIKQGSTEDGTMLVMNLLEKMVRNETDQAVSQFFPDRKDQSKS